MQLQSYQRQSFSYMRFEENYSVYRVVFTKNTRWEKNKIDIVDKKKP